MIKLVTIALTIVSSIVGALIFLFGPKQIRKRKQQRFLKEVRKYEKKADECYQKGDIDGFNKYNALAEQLRTEISDTTVR